MSGEQDVLAHREFGPDEDEILHRMTACLLKSEEYADRKGGQTARHYVRDCLLPLLPKYGLEITLRRKVQP